MRKTSFSSEVAKSNRRRPRLILSGILGALLASATVGGCSATPTCDPEIKGGTKFKVTVLNETSRSSKCHVVKVYEFNPFIIAAAKTQPTADHPDCSVIPAESPPPQDDVIIKGCTPGTTDMLSIFCDIEYPATCGGTMNFSFGGEANQVVDWTKPVIENVYFRIKDDARGCLPDIANCFDEYQVRLERQN